jgi:hypothetical protein
LHTKEDVKGVFRVGELAEFVAEFNLSIEVIEEVELTRNRSHR